MIKIYLNYIISYSLIAWLLSLESYFILFQNYNSQIFVRLHQNRWNGIKWKQLICIPRMTTTLVLKIFKFTQILLHYIIKFSNSFISLVDLFTSMAKHFQFLMWMLPFIDGISAKRYWLKNYLKYLDVVRYFKIHIL